MFETNGLTDIDYEHDYWGDDVLQSTYMPACCGLRILMEFGYTDDGGMSAGLEPSMKEVKEFVTKQIKEMRDDPGMEESGALITLNDKQMKKLWPTLEKEGFRKLTKFYHPGHGNMIYILFKAAFKSKADAKKCLEAREKKGHGRYW